MGKEKKSIPAIAFWLAVAVLAAGIMILAVGLYYCVIKAGIPYQDPSLKIQIEYAVNSGIGEVLTKLGAGITFLGSVVLAAFWLMGRKGKK